MCAANRSSGRPRTRFAASWARTSRSSRSVTAISRRKSRIRRCGSTTRISSSWIRYSDTAACRCGRGCECRVGASAQRGQPVDTVEAKPSHRAMAHPFLPALLGLAGLAILLGAAELVLRAIDYSELHITEPHPLYAYDAEIG